jgi:phosphatidylglycerophosphate synthase
MNIPPDPSHTDVTKHKRANQIALGFLERPAINWLVRHMPAWVTPDLLTIVALLASVLTGVSYILSRNNPAFLWLASFGFLLNWFGDSLDGNLARYRKIERPRYGFFIDHTLDALGTLFIFLGLGLSGYVDLTLALIALVGYLLVSSMVFIYTYVSGEFRIAYVDIGPTEMRAIAILSNTLIFFIGNPIIQLPWFKFHLYDGIVSLIVAFLYIGYVVVVIIKSIELNKLDTKPKNQ